MNLFTRTVVFLTFGLSASAFAATCGGPVKFDQGDTSKTLSVRVTGYQVCTYWLWAKKGQRLQVVLQGAQSASAWLYGKDSHAFEDTEGVTLNHTGKQIVRIVLPRAQARKGKTEHVEVKFQVTD